MMILLNFGLMRTTGSPLVVPVNYPNLTEDPEATVEYNCNFQSLRVALVFTLCE